jgi:hypothetical protein
MTSFHTSLEMRVGVDRPYNDLLEQGDQKVYGIVDREIARAKDCKYSLGILRFPVVEELTKICSSLIAWTNVTFS